MDDLYHPRILELAADIPNLGRLEAPDGASTKVSRVCGSVVTVELNVKDGVVSAIAVHPKACALGQAATGVLAMNAVGAAPAEIRAGTKPAMTVCQTLRESSLRADFAA